MTILYIGTGEIGVPALRWLIEESGHHIAGVACQPDRPAGRKQTLMPPATKVLAAGAGVPVFQPEKINDPAVLDQLAALRPDVTVVMAYGQFLPKRLREGARLACINLHASLLPRWRGASPIPSAIAAGDAGTGVTVMHVVKEMDAGDMILAERTPILPNDTGGTLHDRLAALAPVALARALPLLEVGTAPREPQPPEDVTHCAKLHRGLGRIDWSKPSAEIERLIRAYDPWPGTHTFLPDGRTLKIFPPVELAPLPSPAAPGEIIHVDKSALVIAAGGGALRLTGKIQAEGGRPLSVREFLAGHSLSPGQKIGAADTPE